MSDRIVIIQEPVAIVMIADEQTVTPINVTVTQEAVEVVQIAESAPGGGASSAGFVFGEAPTGAINGVNATYSTAYEFVPETVQVFLNGVLLTRVAEFNTSGAQIINLTVSPGAGEAILVNYVRG